MPNHNLKPVGQHAAPGGARLPGFGLVELLVTLVVLAIIMTLGAPAFRDMVMNNRATTHANELVSALKFARSEAIRQGRNVSATVVHLDQGWMVRVVSQGEALLELDRADSGVLVLGENDSVVTFGPTGTPAAGVNLNMQPVQCSKEQGRRIFIRPSGTVGVLRQECE